MGHHHDHGLGFAIGDEVIQDDVGAAIHHPAGLGFTIAMKQGVDRIFGARLVTTGRRVDPEVTIDAHGPGGIQDHPNLAVRHGPCVVERCTFAGHFHKTGHGSGTRGARHEADIGRIRQFHTLDTEVVDPELGRQRTNGEAPDAVVALHHWLGALALQDLA